MPVEAGTFISDFVASYPTGSDVQSQGDDHLRLIKSVLQSTFPQTGKAFRFPVDTAVQTTNYNVVFPTDQNKIIPFNTASNNLIAYMPIPSGVNANGWGLDIVKVSSDSNAVLVSSASLGVNGSSFFALRSQYEGVRVVYSATIGTYLAFPMRMEFAVGTQMSFHQNSAPAGWQKVTDANYNNRAMRLITGSVTLGGSTDFTTVFSNRTILQANLPNVNLTALSAGDHSHTTDLRLFADVTTSGGGGRLTTGGGGSLAQPVTNTTGAHTHTVPLGGSGTPMDFVVKYIDMILASRL